MAMAPAKKASKQKVTRKPQRTKITYETVPAWGPLFRARMALADAQAEAEATRSGAAGGGLGKAADEALRRMILEQARKVSELERRMRGGSAKTTRGFGPPVKLPAFYIESYSLAPTTVAIGTFFPSNGDFTFQPSNLIYPCPDDGSGHFWSAWFANGQVQLDRLSQFEIAGSNFTGKLSVSAGAVAQGIANIESGGRVCLATECGICVYRQIDDSPNFRCIAMAGATYPYGQYPYIATTGTGIVQLNGSETHASLQMKDARPKDVLVIRQLLSIYAVRAEVQLGPSCSDCATGETIGLLETTPPAVELEYTNLLRWQQTLPLLPPWKS